jgi:hypothetical protein
MGKPFIYLSYGFIPEIRVQISLYIFSFYMYRPNCCILSSCSNIIISFSLSPFFGRDDLRMFYADNFGAMYHVTWRKRSKSINLWMNIIISWVICLRQIFPSADGSCGSTPHVNLSTSSRQLGDEVPGKGKCGSKGHFGSLLYFITINSVVPKVWWAKCI